MARIDRQSNVLPRTPCPHTCLYSCPRAGLNVLIMASQHYNMPQYWADFLDIANLAFTAVYIAEMAVKILPQVP